MATIPKTSIPKEYKIEKNIPITRSGGNRTFDETLPEYVTMLKLKVGDSFEFPRERINFIHNCRVHLRKKGSPLTFTFPTVVNMKKNPQKKTGRCWRVKDGSFKTYGPKKHRAKGAAIDLKEVK
jgi:hypothetical protein